MISIESALTRPVEPGHLGIAPRSLYRVEWKAAQRPSSNGTPPRFAILGEIDQDPVLIRVANVGLEVGSVLVQVKPPPQRVLRRTRSSWTLYAIEPLVR